MDGERVEMTIEHVIDNSNCIPKHDRIVFHLESRETGEIRSLVFTYQEVYNKMFRARRWWKTSKHIIDKVILETRGSCR